MNQNKVQYVIESIKTTFFTGYMNGFKGNVMVKRVMDDSVTLKGSGELVGYND
ncbi:hypothetical protein [Bacillus mycoides]|uniref:hypothetical protein n=1 Tax=Bacillus mycoides TaxID=1405 RepID=UPI001301BB7B|nr:hypothetical protein [Bacillus mycoides]